jgi:hypothetical protein
MQLWMPMSPTICHFQAAVRKATLSLTPEAGEPRAPKSKGRKEWCPSSRRETSIFLWLLFSLCPNQLGDTFTLVRAHFTQSTDLNTIFSRNTLTDTPRNNVLPDIWASQGPGKLHMERTSMCVICSTPLVPHAPHPICRNFCHFWCPTSGHFLLLLLSPTGLSPVTCPLHCGTCSPTPVFILAPYVFFLTEWSREPSPHHSISCHSSAHVVERLPSEALSSDPSTAPPTVYIRTPIYYHM